MEVRFRELDEFERSVSGRLESSSGELEAGIKLNAVPVVPLYDLENVEYNLSVRGVAQSGRVLGSGPRGRRFKSARPDS